MEDIKYFCKVCSQPIHPKRAQLGYKTTCVSHSDAKRFTGLLVTEGRESEETSSIQVIRDPKLAQEIERLKSSQAPDIY